MTYEYSCGAVVFTRIDGVPHYLLVRAKDQPEGCHGFPKGHMEPGETERETALREIFEETGVRVTLLEGFRAVTEYDLHELPGIRKRVVFFLGEFSGQTVRVQESELASFALAPFEEALELTEFSDSKRILTRADNFLAGRPGTLPDLTYILNLLEVRPELYIGCRDIMALDQFLRGYQFAAMEEHPGFDSWLDRDFREYLAQKYADTRTVNWCHLIRDHEPDGDSTDAFFRLVHEFQAQP